MLHKNDKTRVAVVEDLPDIREGLKKLIDSNEDYDCCGVFGNMEDALEHIGRVSPHVVLIDLRLPAMSGIEGIRILRSRFPQIHLLVLSVYDDDERVFQALCAGACGYLLKTTTPEKLLDSIRDVVNGGAAMSPEIARKVIAIFQEIAPPRQSKYGLTPHEMRLLKLLVEGHNYKSAAAVLGVTVHAISFHMRHVYEKLEVHSKSEAVAKALRHRLVN